MKKTILLACLIGWLGFIQFDNCKADWLDGKMTVRQADAGESVCKPFPLESVRLQPSVFSKVQNLEKLYLLSISPDRFLVRFRSLAGLPAKPGVEVYGGWEETTPLAGHTFGHYISAAAMMYASTGDFALKEKVDESVAGLAEVESAFAQDPRWAGYLSAIPDGKNLFTQTAEGNVELMGQRWIVPFYTQHKILAGLLDAYRYCGNEKALQLAIKHADWMIRFFNPLSEQQFQRMLRTEFGGIASPLAELYLITGDKKYLDFAKRFEQKSIIDPWKNGVDNLPGIHANTQIPKAAACAKFYQANADLSEKKAAEFFWNTVVKHHTYPTGGNSDREHFGPEDKLDNRFTDPTETCNSYNMLKLTQYLFSWNPDNPDYFDYYERALYNHIIGAFNHNTNPQDNFRDGLTCYFIHFKPGDCRRYQSPYNDFSCCFGTGMENPARYGESIYWHDNQDSKLYVNLFIPSSLDWNQKGVKVELKTRYPETGKVELVINAVKKTQFTLKVRVPFWTGQTGYRDFAIELNPGESKTVSVDYPMSLRTESLLGNSQRLSIFYGPVLLTADLGPIEGTPEIPAIVCSSDCPSDWLVEKEGCPLHFVARPGAFSRDNLEFQPFYSLHGRRNCIFFDKLSSEQWNQRKAELQEKQLFEKRLQERTVDTVAPGEMQSERDHKVVGEQSDTGDFNNRKFRHAIDGWFSYQVKVDPNAENELTCTFWGSESGQRKFVILADQTEIARVSLGNNAPNEFYQTTYVLPKSVTEGKSTITLKFQGEPGNFAGGVFGIAVRRAESK